MSRSTIASLESQLSTANHELELATFLNKGILQTNTEYKLRIAELEGENIALRKAESRLAETEDALGDSEIQVKRLEKTLREWEHEAISARGKREDIERLRDELARDRDRERKKREKITREKEYWEERYWEMRDNVEKAIRLEPFEMESCSFLISKGPKPIDYDLCTPTTKPRFTSQSTNHASRKPSTLPLAPLALSSPIRRSQRATAKKRKRITGSDTEHEDVEDECVPKQQKETIHPPILSEPETEIITSEIRVPSSLKRRGPAIAQRRNERFKVKEEPVSPGHNWPDEDEDDPL
ncbi:uncharacterized protein L203_100050 [Cryptococcus depauperatus CBS 7841]|uniref:Uncharacterized protein n=1 Tax=Cryptococcus depauperatus CBS 7841 TaxID=1295531 RepID=A0AAJ8JMC3_9TREE